MHTVYATDTALLSLIGEEGLRVQTLDGEVDLLCSLAEFAAALSS